MKDSTLNWDPRLKTEKKSTPKTLANSLSSKVVKVPDPEEADCLRCLGDGFGFLKKLKVCDHTHGQVLKKHRGVQRNWAEVPLCQSFVTILRNPSPNMSRKHSLKAKALLTVS